MCLMYSFFYKNQPFTTQYNVTCSIVSLTHTPIQYRAIPTMMVETLVETLDLVPILRKIDKNKTENLTPARGALLGCVKVWPQTLILLNKYGLKQGPANNIL